MSIPTPEEVRREMLRAASDDEIRCFELEFPILWEILKKYAEGTATPHPSTPG